MSEGNLNIDSCLTSGTDKKISVFQFQFFSPRLTLTNGTSVLAQSSAAIWLWRRHFKLSLILSHIVLYRCIELWLLYFTGSEFLLKITSAERYHSTWTDYKNKVNFAELCHTSITEHTISKMYYLKVIFHFLFLIYGGNSIISPIKQVKHMWKLLANASGRETPTCNFKWSAF